MENRWLLAIDSTRSIAIYHTYTHPVISDEFFNDLSYQESIESYWTTDQRVHENLLNEWGEDWTVIKEKGLARLLYSPKPR